MRDLPHHPHNSNPHFPFFPDSRCCALYWALSRLCINSITWPSTLLEVSWTGKVIVVYHRWDLRNSFRETVSDVPSLTIPLVLYTKNTTESLPAHYGCCLFRLYPVDHLVPIPAATVDTCGTVNAVKNVRWIRWNSDALHFQSEKC